MSKKNETQEVATPSKAEILNMLSLQASRKGGKRLKDRYYSIRREWTIEEIQNLHLSPQAVKCVSIILDIATDTPREVDLFNAFNTEEAETLFAGAKQTPWEVFTYYRKPIIEAGFLSELA